MTGSWADEWPAGKCRLPASRIAQNLRGPLAGCTIRSTPRDAQSSAKGPIRAFWHQVVARQLALNGRRLRGTYFGLSVRVAGRVFGPHSDTQRKRTFKNPDV